MTDSHCLDLLAPVLAAVKPRALLLLGPDARAGLPDGLETAITRIEAPPWLERLPPDARFDLVFVSGVVETLDKPEAVRLLARLRDVHTQRLYVRVADEAAWTVNDFIALGMEQVGAWEEAGRAVRLHKFDLYTYKPAPEWFNAKYWAHPELWDVYPWLKS